MKTATRLTILCLSISLGATGKEFKTLPISDEVAKTYKLDNEFYSKGTLVQDILIATLLGSQILHTLRQHTFSI